jgi:hypothetical protein
MRGEIDEVGIKDLLKTNRYIRRITKRLPNIMRLPNRSPES